MTDIGTRIARLEARMKAVERASRLKSASLDGNALELRDADGTSLRGVIGQQADGTTAVNIVNGAAPAAPSTPTVAPALGGIAVTWDGTLTGGATIPLDWARVEVHASTTDGFTPDATTLKATIETPQGATVYIPATDPQYVRLLARNTSGTASTPTAQAGPYTPRAIVDTDVADGSITETKIATDAVTSPKIKAGAVQTAELDALAVTTAKLAAGSVDATALKADAVTGKTISGGTITGTVVQTATSGARITLNESSSNTVNLYNTSGALTAKIDPNASDGLTHGGAFISYGTDGGGNPVTTQLSNGRVTVLDPNHSSTTNRGGIYSSNPFAGLGYVLAMTPMSLTGNNSPSVSVAAETGSNTADDSITLQSHNLSISSITDFNNARVGILGSLNVGRDQLIGGNLIKATWDSNSVWGWTALTWQTPSYRSGWAGGSSAATRYQAMQIRKDAMDNLHVSGVFHATSAVAAGSYTVADLPSGYFPAKLQPGVALHMSSTDTIKTVCRVAIDSLGTVVIATTSAIAVGDGFYFDPLVVPRGNIA